LLKRKVAFLLALAISVFMTADAFAQRALLLSYDGKVQTYKGSVLTLKLNGETVSSDVPPIIMSDRTLVPVRALFEKLGAEVRWDARSQKMHIKFEGADIEFKANDINAKVNGKAVKMDLSAKKINNRLMIPVTFMGKQLGMRVNFNSKDSIVTVDQNSNLKGVEHSKYGGGDRVLLNFDRYRDYTVIRITDPDRIVVDLPYTCSEAKDKEKKLDVDGTLVESVRYIQYDKTNTRVVIDTIGQPQYSIEEKKGQLALLVESPTYKNLIYSNYGDRVGFVLKGANLTNDDENPKKLYTEKYDPGTGRYVLTFPNNLADLGNGVFKINDGLLNTVAISRDNKSGKTTMTFNQKDKFFYEILSRPEVNDTAITLLKPASKTERLVVIDAGHGGREPGAIYKGMYEKDINLDIAVKLNSLLKSKKIKTYMIRDDDRYVSLYERARIANDLNAKLFLSIHNNAIDDPDYGGTMTLYRPGSLKGYSLTAKRFAEIIQNALLSKLKTTDRKTIERPNLVVLKRTNMTASLAEIAFMTNKNDMANLQTDSFRQKAAAALCDAVIQALKEVN